MALDLDGVLAALARKRPVFHSEADFRHALAWQIQLAHPDAAIRLHTRPVRRVRLDLLVVLDGRRTAIELKYLPGTFTGSVLGESFEFTNGEARDQARHDVIKDVARIEGFLAAGYADEGWALALAGDRNYWLPGRVDTIDVAFHLTEGRVLQGEMRWAEHAGAGSTNGRDVPLALRGTYECRWRDYSTVRGERGGETVFRCLALPVVSPGAG
jgi:hypothetical protein